MQFTALADVLVPTRRDRFLEDLQRGERLLPHLAALFAVIVFSGAVYGAALGSWRSPLLASYVAAKFPLLLIATSVITSLFNWITGSVLGLTLRYLQVLVLTFFGLAVAALVLAAVAPVAWFMTISLPPATPSARTVHNLLYLLHTLLVGAAGLAGTIFLWRILSHLTSAKIARSVYAIWLLVFALVGGELGWLLRPFVGSVYQPVVFLRAEAFQRNVYEFAFTDIIPHLTDRNCECKEKP